MKRKVGCRRKSRSRREIRSERIRAKSTKKSLQSFGALTVTRNHSSLQVHRVEAGAGRNENHSHTGDPTSLTSTRQGWQGMCVHYIYHPPRQPRNLDSNWRQQESQSRCGPCSINRYVGLRLRCKKMLAQWRCSEEINNFLLNAVGGRPFPPWSGCAGLPALSSSLY